ncbi:6900_t:CDS:1, partial [Acaulospora morrowiae]
KMPISLSNNLLWRIVYLYHNGYSNKKIRSLLYISRATVGRVLRIYKKWGYVKDPFIGSKERRKLFDTDDMK